MIDRTPSGLRARARSPRIAILLENVPVERDRRVWRQAQALVGAGLDVTVICPAPVGDGSRDGRRVRVVDGIEIRSFAAAAERSGMLGFVWEYSVAWLQMSWILLRLHRAGPLSGVQACNPPDIFFPLAWWARRHGIPFVFDQHDLCPELFETRFLPRSRETPDRSQAGYGLRRLVLAVLRRCERETYLGASRVIATNQSYRRIAIERGGLSPSDVVVVRNGPDPEVMRRSPSRLRSADGRRLVVWMGNIGPQDGLDDAVRAVGHLVHGLERTDTDFVFIGQGEALAEARQVAVELKVDRWVTFTGWIPDDEAFAWLSAADVGLSADPPGPLNDKSTMNKTLEYMSFGLPVVAHDLHETRRSAGAAAVYATEGTPEGLAVCLDRLLRDQARMDEMGRIGRQRIERHLGWPRQAGVYVDLWLDLVNGPRQSTPTGEETDAPGSTHAASSGPAAVTDLSEQQSMTERNGRSIEHLEVHQ